MNFYLGEVSTSSEDREYMTQQTKLLCKCLLFFLKVLQINKLKF